MSDYPKMLYKIGNQLDWDGLSLDFITVDDADAEAAAEGYKTAEDILKPEKPKK